VGSALRPVVLRHHPDAGPAIVRVPSTVSAAGRLLDARDAPLEWAEMWLEADPSNPERLHAAFVRAASAGEGPGGFSFDEVLPGRYWLHARSEPEGDGATLGAVRYFGIRLGPLAVHGSDALPLTLRAPPAVRVEGRVCDRDGNPLWGAEVMPVIAGLRGVWFGVDTLVDGTFALVLAWTGPARLACRCANGVVAEVPVDLPRGGTTWVEIRLP
jgi:hypothetical protein